MSESTETGLTSDARVSLRRNYVALLLHGIFGETGFRILGAPTLLPAYIYILSGSELFVGVALAAQHFGSVLSAIPGSTLIEHRPRVLSALFTVGLLMRSQILAMALVGFLLPLPWSLALTCLALTFFGMFNGMQAVIFPVIMSKLIPIEVRGRLVGIRTALAGLVSAGVAYAGGSYFIETNALGNGYATTFLLAFCLTMIGLATLLIVREPMQLGLRERSSMQGRLRQIPSLLASDRGFSAFVVARALSAAGMIAMPYYIVFAGQLLGLSGKTIGLLTVAFLLSSTVSTILWGLMADRIGNRAVFGMGTALWAVSTIAVMLVPGDLVWFAFVFAGVGAGLGATQIAANNLVLEFGSYNDLAMRIAVSYTANITIFALAPLIGGLLTQVVSYPVIFATASVFQVLSLIVLIYLVDEPRHRVRGL